MSLTRLILRGLIHYRRNGIFVAFGIAVATAALVGSLLVGDSVSFSLRETALARLGSMTHLVASRGWFRAQLADDLKAALQPAGATQRVIPLISLHGAGTSAATQETAPRVSIYGVDRDFWSFYKGDAPNLTGRQAAINEALARDLRLKVGDDLIIIMPKPGMIASDNIFAAHDLKETTISRRVELAYILPNQGPGGFGVESGSATPRTVFTDLSWLARMLGKEGSANVLALDSDAKPTTWTPP